MIERERESASKELSKHHHPNQTAVQLHLGSYHKMPLENAVCSNALQLREQLVYPFYGFRSGKKHGWEKTTTATATTRARLTSSSSSECGRGWGWWRWNGRMERQKRFRAHKYHIMCVTSYPMWKEKLCGLSQWNYALYYDVSHSCGS